MLLEIILLFHGAWYYNNVIGTWWPFWIFPSKYDTLNQFYKIKNECLGIISC